MSVFPPTRNLFRLKHFPSYIAVYAGKSYPKQAVIFHLPYTGNGDLFRYTPGVWSTSAPEVFLENQCLCFEIVDLEDNAERIRERAEEIKSSIKNLHGNLTPKINDHNKQLPNFVKQCFQERKQTFFNRNQVVASLGVPVKKRENLPETYAIPTPSFRNRINVKPRVTEIGYKPEPTLPDSVYHDILQTIHDVGKGFERLPATYSDKDEEALRDHILLLLELRFEGSATGETFNKAGKTDVLIRHENSNAFIAECKFWRGQEVYFTHNNPIVKIPNMARFKVRSNSVCAKQGFLICAKDCRSGNA